MISRQGGLGVTSWARSTAWGAILMASAVVALASAVFASASCSKNNAEFCKVKEDCDVGQECSSNSCIDSADATPAPDATPACPTESHQCLPLAPADWNGPTLRAELAAEDGLPACAITEPGGLVAGAGFETGGSCECSCTNATTLACTQGRVESVPGAGGIACTQAQCEGGCENQILPANTCITRVEPNTAQPNLRFRAGNITGGSCEAGTASAVAPAAEFNDRVALCAAEAIVGDCGEQAVCAPLPEAGFAATSCVFRDGDHECPEGTDFTERTLTFGSLGDGRACDACECDVPIGSSCRGGVEGYASGICQGSSDLDQGLGCTATGNWNNLFGYKYVPAPGDVDCAPTSDTVGITGEVTGVDPVTVCCTAAP